MVTQHDTDKTRNIREVASAIGSEWDLLVLYGLQEGELRFSELKERLDANPSTLSRVLERLEDTEMVVRRIEDRPIATYYRLSERGRALSLTFDDLEKWADEYVSVSTCSR